MDAKALANKASWLYGIPVPCHINHSLRLPNTLSLWEETHWDYIKTLLYIGPFASFPRLESEGEFYVKCPSCGDIVTSILEHLSVECSDTTFERNKIW